MVVSAYEVITPLWVQYSFAYFGEYLHHCSPVTVLLRYYIMLTLSYFTVYCRIIMLQTVLIVIYIISDGAWASCWLKFVYILKLEKYIILMLYKTKSFPSLLLLHISSNVPGLYFPGMIVTCYWLLPLIHVKLTLKKGQVVPVLKLSSMPWRHTGEWMYRATFFLTSAVVGGEWSASHPGRFAPRERPWYLLNRRLGGPQSWCGQNGERILDPTRTVTLTP
jgi:hypothetical protein